MLLEIVNPSAEIREGFENDFAQKDDRQSMTEHCPVRNAFIASPGPSPHRVL